MSTPLGIWVLSSDGNFDTVHVTTSYNWEINNDYISSEQSTFELLDNGPIVEGQFIIAKRLHTADVIYIGIINAFENGQVKTGLMQTGLNYDIIMRPGSGKDINAHLAALIKNNNSKNQPLGAVSEIEVDGDASAWSYQQEDAVKVKNMLSYFTHMFKKYRNILTFQLSSNGISGRLSKSTKNLALKNNSIDFVDWDVSVSPADTGTNNLIIYSIDSTPTVPKILSSWYLTRGGDLTQSIDDNVRVPVLSKGVIYESYKDDETGEIPSYQEIAESELKASTYAHEINVSIRNESKLVQFADFNSIGALATITYDNTIYQSVLTGWTMKSDNAFTTFMFGNVRSSLSDLLEDE
ncbi:hypothetical protein H9L19_06855 [Weissella diestrammenae]|uniref:Uncharacterized protein n=1 Tax=Weissella diestrammenae TaxID=1162633 RepID=A0A7G9T4R2_9LACO|nr:hypothetical protein [Weissella diestrammenae]MCM0582798.1 hypothetical protein [Weissella diestrammenae]QNN75087.1 hypothetical protein H9L19_06855 [Weissella diestrammenae]